MNIKKNLFFKGIDYYETHLIIVSIFIPEEKQLKPKERKVLAAFMYVSDKISSSSHINAKTKKEVKKLLGLSTSSLSIYLKTFRSHGYIVNTDSHYKEFNIIENILIKESPQHYLIKLNKISEDVS